MSTHDSTGSPASEPNSDGTQADPPTGPQHPAQPQEPQQPQQAWQAQQPVPAQQPPQPWQQVGSSSQPPTNVWAPPAAPLPPFGSQTAYGGPPAQPRRRRWLLPVAGLVALLVVALVGALVLLNLNQPPGTAATLGGYDYLAADSAMAIELRLDLPADQREQFVRFATRFPQFGDAAQVETRMDELLNEAIGSATRGLANYEDDIKPWFAGWIIAGGRFPADASAGQTGPAVAVIGSTNRAAAELAMERLRGADTWTSEAGPGGSTVWIGSQRWDGGATSYAVTDDAIVVGDDLSELRAALERKISGSGGLTGVESFNTAIGRQPAGRMAAFWFDYEALTESLGSGPMGNPFALNCPGMAEPRTFSGSMYMQDGRAHIDVVVENSPGGPAVQARDSGLAQRLPADTFFFIDSRDVGSNVSTTVGCLRSNPMLSSQIRDIEEALGQPIDQLVRWAGDAAAAARFDGNRVTGGLVVRVTDQARAAEAMGQLRGLITAAGSSGGMGGVNVIEEDYRGARMVTFEIRDDFGGMGPPGPESSLAYAFTEDLLVIGVDASFARAVIDTHAADSLASDPEYRRAIDAAGGASNTGAMYFDFATGMTLVDAFTAPMLGGGMFDDPMREIRAIVSSLESVAAVSVVDGDTALTRFVLTTREQ